MDATGHAIQTGSVDWGHRIVYWNSSCSSDDSVGAEKFSHRQECCYHGEYARSV